MRTLKNSLDVTQTLRKHKEWLNSNGEKGEAAVFVDCSFNHQVIAGERLDRVRFINCNFYVGTISNCDLNDTEFVDCEFVKLHISGSRMSNCVFKDCELRFCEFYGTAIVKTSLIHCLVIADEFKEMLLTNNRQEEEKTILTKTENEILKDNQLHNVLSQRNLNNENRAKRVLYKAILADNYFLARALIYMQAYRSKR